MLPELEIRVMAAPWLRGYEFIVISGDRIVMCQTDDRPALFKLEPTAPGARSPTTGVFGATAAQVLMDDLYIAGVRPTEGAGSAGAMAATQEHIADLRRILFDKKTPE